jgi:hypothetical protein
MKKSKDKISAGRANAINQSCIEEQKLPDKLGIYLNCKYTSPITGSECGDFVEVSVKELEKIQDKNLPIRCKKHIGE